MADYSNHNKYDNYTDGDYGGYYRKDGYFYTKRLGDVFRFDKKNDNIIIENIDIKHLYIDEFISDTSGFKGNNLIFNNCTFVDILRGKSSFSRKKNTDDKKKNTFDKELIFKECIFDDIVDFSNVIFNKKVIFEDCRFGNKANFSDAQFNNEVSFNNSIFNNKAIFTNTSFSSKAYFNNITVSNKNNNGFYFENKENLIDEAEIIFDKAQFYAPIFFNGRYFKEKISFENTIIDNTFDFTDVNFGSKAKLSGIVINYHRISDIEIWINIFNDRVKEKYLWMARQLDEVSKEIYKKKSRYLDNKIYKEDNTILISRKDASAMLGISVNTLKTWTARGQSELVFKKEGQKCGYTLASIKKYNASQPLKDLKQALITDYAIAINKEQSITEKSSYVEAKKKMYNLNLKYIPIMDKKKIVCIFSNTIECALTYKMIINPNLNLQELTIKDIINEVGSNIEGFLFTKPQTSVKAVKQMFIKDSQYEEGIGVIFLTSNGKADGELVGMITKDNLIRI